MSPRPGRILTSFDISLPATGHRRETLSLPAFIEIRDEILSALEAA